MTKEEKEDLLIKDLKSRLGIYSLIVRWNDEEYNILGIAFGRAVLVKPFMSNVSGNPLLEEVVPYLRPLSSMTAEEKNFIYTKYGIVYIDEDIVNFGVFPSSDSVVPLNILNSFYDWLIEHHFDYRGLIEKGLALEATAEMYKILKEKNEEDNV